MIAVITTKIASGEAGYTGTVEATEVNVVKDFKSW
jgi:hypothetical protein